MELHLDVIIVLCIIFAVFAVCAVCIAIRMACRKKQKHESKSRLSGYGIFENQLRSPDILENKWFDGVEHKNEFRHKYIKLLADTVHNDEIIYPARRNYVHVDPESIEHFYLTKTLDKIKDRIPELIYFEPFIACGEGRNGSAYFVKIQEPGKGLKSVICIKFYTDQAYAPCFVDNPYSRGLLQNIEVDPYTNTVRRDELNSYFKGNSLSNDYSIASHLTKMGAKHVIKVRTDLEPELISFDLYGNEYGNDIPTSIKDKIKEWSKRALNLNEGTWGTIDETALPEVLIKNLTGPVFNDQRKFDETKQSGLFNTDYMKGEIDDRGKEFPSGILPNRYRIIYKDADNLIAFNKESWFNLNHLNVMITEPIYGEMLTNVQLSNDNDIERVKMYYNIIYECYLYGVKPAGMHTDNVMTTVDSSTLDSELNHLIYMDVGKATFHNKATFTRHDVFKTTREEARFSGSGDYLMDDDNRIAVITKLLTCPYETLNSYETLERLQNSLTTAYAEDITMLDEALSQRGEQQASTMETIVGKKISFEMPTGSELDEIKGFENRTLYVRTIYQTDIADPSISPIAKSSDDSTKYFLLHNFLSSLLADWSIVKIVKSCVVFDTAETMHAFISAYTQPLDGQTKVKRMRCSYGGREVAVFEFVQLE